MVGLKAPLALAASSGQSCPGDGRVDRGDSPSAPGPWLGRQFRKRELERQKARALQLSWKEEQPLLETSEKLDSTPEKPHSTPQTLEAEPKPPQKAVGAKEEVSGPRAGPGPWGSPWSALQARAERCRRVRGWLPGLALPPLSCLIWAGDLLL